MNNLSDNATNLLNLIQSTCSPKEKELIANILLNGKNNNSLPLIHAINESIKQNNIGVQKNNIETKNVQLPIVEETESNYYNEIIYKPLPVAYNVYGNFKNEGFQNKVHGTTGLDSYKYAPYYSIYIGSNAANFNSINLTYHNECIVIIAPHELTNDYFFSKLNSPSCRRTFITFIINSDQLDHLGKIHEETQFKLENGEKLIDHFKKNKNLKSKLMVPFNTQPKDYSDEDLEILNFLFNIKDLINISKNKNMNINILDSGKELSYENMQEIARLMSKTRINKTRTISRQTECSDIEKYRLTTGIVNIDYLIEAGPVELGKNYTFKLDYSNGLCNENNFNSIMSNNIVTEKNDFNISIKEYLDNILSEVPEESINTLVNKIKYLNTVLEKRLKGEITLHK